MTLKQLCDMYLNYQYSKLQANDLTPRHHNDQIDSLNKLQTFLGQGRKIKSISTLDLQNYKRKLQRHYGSFCRLNLHISIMKAMFHWARKNDVLNKNIPNIDAISRGKITHKEKGTFSSEQINRLLSCADVKMRAMIWLGLNCGFGCTERMSRFQLKVRWLPLATSYATLPFSARFCSLSPSVNLASRTHNCS